MHEPSNRGEAPVLAVELTKDEYARLAGERTFVLPVGILEEHGPHLPLGTDIFQAEAVVREAAARTGSVVLPTLNYGNCHSTRPFPGSISLSFDTVRQVGVEILSELARHDVASVAIVSGHAGGGHMRALKEAGRDVIAEEPEMTVALTSEWAVLFEHGGETVDGVEVPSADGHAGTMETARMLDLRPDLVGQPPGEHLPQEDAFVLTPTPETALPDGYIGDPSQASDELGAVLHDIAVEALAELFDRIRPGSEP